MTTTAFDLAFDAPTNTLPSLSFSHQEEDGSLSYTTSLVDSAHNVNIPLLLIIHKGKLVHTQEITEESHACLNAKMVREYSDGSMVYTFTLRDASHGLYLNLMCVVFEGRVDHVQVCPPEYHYSEQVQFTLRMAQRELECYAKFADTYFLERFLYWSGMNTTWRARLMEAIEA